MSGEKDQFALITSILEQFARAEAKDREEERLARYVPGPDYPKVDSDDFPEETAKREAPLRRKLKSIILPKVKLKNADLFEVAGTLNELGQRYDRRSPKGQRGVKIEVEGFPLRSSIPPIPGLDDHGAGARASDQRISYSATDVSLAEVLGAITRLSGFKLRFKPYDAPPSSVELWKPLPPEPSKPDQLVTHEYLTPPGMIEVTQSTFTFYTPAEKEVVASENAKYVAVHGTGDSFGAPSSIYLVKGRRLIVRNTEVVHRIVLAKVEAAWRAYYAAEKAKKRRSKTAS
jgi:hypothetical protein